MGWNPPELRQELPIPRLSTRGLTKWTTSVSIKIKRYPIRFTVDWEAFVLAECRVTTKRNAWRMGRMGPNPKSRCHGVAIFGRTPPTRSDTHHTYDRIQWFKISIQRYYTSHGMGQTWLNANTPGALFNPSTQSMCMQLIHPLSVSLTVNLLNRYAIRWYNECNNNASIKETTNQRKK